MNDEERADVERALDSLYSYPDAQFYLRRALGKRTRCEEINGHLFDNSSKWCQCRSCELMKRDKHLAEHHDCPTPAEAIPQQIDDDW